MKKTMMMSRQRQRQRQNPFARGDCCVFVVLVRRFHHHLSVDKDLIAHPGKTRSMMHFVFFPFKAFKEDKEDFEASASFLQQFDEDETLRDDPLHNVVVKVVVIVFAFVFTLRSRTISVLKNRVVVSALLFRVCVKP